MTEQNLEMVAWSNLLQQKMTELSQAEVRVGKLRSDVNKIQRKIRELREDNRD